MGFLTLDEAIVSFIRGLNQAFADQLKFLLESKHLYQKASVETERIYQQIEARVQVPDQKPFGRLVQKLLAEKRLLPAETELWMEEKQGPRFPEPTLVVRNVKVYCDECGSREVFSSISHVDVTNEMLKKGRHDSRINPPPPHIQLFFLAYQCQRCMGAPIGFLVRREQSQLILEGRSPIEHVEIPTFIPKAERQHFRDAVIAMNTGKTLAALFYLRLFVEQFARRQTGIKGRETGDKIMDTYAETLPVVHRDQMPSLRHLYDLLSDALHSAREDEKLFEEARTEIERHFDIRRVFKITELN